MNLLNYRAVLLASLRPLGKDWMAQHEVAWSRVGGSADLAHRLPRRGGQADGSARRFAKFLAVAPAGQGYFNSQRLVYISYGQPVKMTMDMYMEPKRLTEEISAHGLWHVGSGIPSGLLRRCGSWRSSCALADG